MLKNTSESSGLFIYKCLPNENTIFQLGWMHNLVA
jgi:hypothetical protein